MADPGAYTKEQLATLHSQIVSNLEWAWEMTGGSEDELAGLMVQISQVVAKQFKDRPRAVVPRFRWYRRLDVTPRQKIPAQGGVTKRRSH